MLFLSLFTVSKAFIALYGKIGSDALEYLNKQYKEYYRKEHDKVLISVLAVVYGNLAESAAAYNSAHGRITEYCGNCYRGV